jgi:PAS domain S-box-containing protein
MVVEATGRVATSEPRTASSDEAQRRRAARAVAIGRWLCLAAAALGATGLLGWLSASSALYTLVPGQPAMANTELALLLTGAAGVLLGWPTRRLRALCVLAGAVVLVIGGGSLAETAFGVDLHIDQLLVSTTLGTHPGRPGPPTALAFTLLGLAILIFDSFPTARTRPSEWLLITAALLGLVGVTGQLLGKGGLHRPPGSPLVGMAASSAFGVFLSAIGMLLTRPFAGVMAVATSSGPGGTMMRRIAPESVLVPFLLSFGITRLFRVLNLRDFPLVVASIAVATMAVGLAILDLTARVLDRTHDELSANRKRIRDIIAHASDGIFVADREGRLTEVNEAGSRMLAMPLTEIIGKMIRDFVLPDEVERLAATRAEVLRGGTQIAEWHLRRASGDYIPVESSTSLLPDGRWQAFVRDISERKAVEEATRRAAAKIEGIISIASDAIISIDEAQRITMFNHGAEQTFGWTPEEAIGQPLDILIPERFRVAHHAHVHAFAAEPARARPVGGHDTVILGRHKDGTEFVAEAAISKLRTDDGLTFTVVLRDVSRERQRAEHDRLLAAIGPLLTSSLEPKQFVKEAANLLVREFADACVIDRVEDPDAGGGVSRLAVVHRDPQKQETALAMENLSLAADRPHLASEALATRQTKIVARVTPEYIDSIAQSPEHRRLLGDLAPVSLLTVPVQTRGLLLGALTFMSTNENRRFDERDAVFAEEIALRLAHSIDNARLFEIAQSAVKSRDEVMGIVAHDLRNPLGTILMGTSLLKENGDGNGNGDGNAKASEVETWSRVKSADTIERAAKRMNHLIRDLLDVTRSESGRLSVEHVPVSAGEIVRAAAAAQQDLAANASLHLETKAADDLPKVLGDRDRLLQIFENLIGNAIKFTPAGGTIAVAAVARDAEVEFSVHDTGQGIPAEDLPHVFERLWQGRRRKLEGAGKKDGSGMGLLIVKALVTAHGGRVWAESQPGHGSTFFFTIPVARQAAGAPT